MFPWEVAFFFLPFPTRSGVSAWHCCCARMLSFRLLEGRLLPVVGETPVEDSAPAAGLSCMRAPSLLWSNVGAICQVLQ